MADEKKEGQVEVDWEAKYNETQANLDKVAAERENYKKVALSKKDKDSETEDERFSRIIDERIAATTEGRLLKEKEQIAEAAIKENKELKVALKNRGQVGASATQGGGQSETEVKTEFWTAEQLAYFKKKGIDPQKAKENYMKIKNN